MYVYISVPYIQSYICSIKDFKCNMLRRPPLAVTHTYVHTNVHHMKLYIIPITTYFYKRVFVHTLVSMRLLIVA